MNWVNFERKVSSEGLTESATPAEGFLAIDIGSSSTRAALIGVRGGRIATATRPSRARYRADQRVEIPAHELLDDVAAVVREVTTVGRPIACGVTAQLGIVLADEELNPLTDVLPWADRRAAREADLLAQAVPASELQRTGRHVDAEHVAPKLLWLQAHERPTFDRARVMLSLKDIIVAQLTGEAITDESHASYTLLFDVVDRCWSSKLIALSGVPERLLPRVLSGTALAGRVTNEGFGRLGVPVGTPVAVGGPDGTVGALAAGAITPGWTVDVAGTTDVVIHTTETPIMDPRHSSVLNAHVVPSLWTIGGPTGLTGGASAKLAELLGIASDDWAYGAIEERGNVDRAAEDDPYVVTEMTGARFPNWNNSVRGGLFGLLPSHTATQILRASDEGSAFLVRAGLDELRRLGRYIENVVVVGGRVRRVEALRLRADVWGVRVATLADHEASVTGAAMMAAVASGHARDLLQARALLAPMGLECEPRQERFVQETRRYAKWRMYREAGRKRPYPT